MKGLLIAMFISSTALATTYECNFVVKLDGKDVGIIQASKVGIGMTMGTIAIKKINEKKNIFGTVTKWDELQLYGLIQNAGEFNTARSEIKNSLEGKIVISSYSIRGGQKTSQDIATVEGIDDFDINSNENQYSVTGGCSIKP